MIYQDEMKKKKNLPLICCYALTIISILLTVVMKPTAAVSK
jgi:hypothetical protein